MPHVRTNSRHVLPAVLVLLLLTACRPASSLGVQSISSAPAVADQTAAAVPPLAPAQSDGGAVPPGSSTATAQSGLHAVHSPNVVTDDEHLAPGQCHLRTAPGGQPLPDPACTPGAIDPAVTQANIASTICRSGYTTTVRPSSSDTGRWKIRTYVFYGLDTATSGEYDHLVSLELGGANSTSNLWIEPGKIPNPKDQVENRLHDEVCAGQITLATAQQEIASDWTTAP